jgi:ribosomal protein S18 acetylase RimI-like enzyme
MIAEIAPFDNDRHRDAVIALWKRVFGYETPRNDPDLVIDRKLAVGTIMAGYDGHRGWIYALAVHPCHRRQGIGSRLLARAERALADRGCVKVNLQILATNAPVQAFYEAHGYAAESRISMGKSIPENIPGC